MLCTKKHMNNLPVTSTAMTPGSIVINANIFKIEDNKYCLTIETQEEKKRPRIFRIFADSQTLKVDLNFLKGSVVKVFNINTKTLALHIEFKKEKRVLKWIVNSWGNV